MKSRQSKNEERYNAEHGYTHEEVRQEAASSENWDKVRISIPLDRIVKYEEVRFPRTPPPPPPFRSRSNAHALSLAV